MSVVSSSFRLVMPGSATVPSDDPYLMPSLSLGSRAARALWAAATGAARAKAKKIPEVVITQSGLGYKITLDGKHDLFLTAVNCPQGTVTDFVGMLRNAWRAYGNK